LQFHSAFNSRRWTPNSPNFFFNGNQAHLTGTAKNGKAKLSFTVDVTDNGEPGTLDTFSIQVSNGYSASGNLTDGNITIH